MEVKIKYNIDQKWDIEWAKDHFEEKTSSKAIMKAVHFYPIINGRLEKITSEFSKLQKAYDYIVKLKEKPSSIRPNGFIKSEKD